MKRLFSIKHSCAPLGSNNLPDCSNMCHESSGKALTQAIGIGKGTVHLEDLKNPNSFLSLDRPGTNHPRMLTALRDAENGCFRVVVLIAPRNRVATFQTSTGLHVRRFSFNPTCGPPAVRIGGDALLKGVMKILVEQQSFNQSFIEHQIPIEKIDEFKQSLDAFTWKQIEGKIQELIEIASKDWLHYVLNRMLPSHVGQWGSHNIETVLLLFKKW